MKIVCLIILNKNYTNFIKFNFYILNLVKKIQKIIYNFNKSIMLLVI